MIFASFSREGPAIPSAGPSLKFFFGRRSMERQLDQKLGGKGEGERNHQQHAEADEHIQRLRRIHLAPIESVQTAPWRMFVSLRSHPVPCQIAHKQASMSLHGLKDEPRDVSIREGIRASDISDA
jgi:hypothetical protein